MAGHRPARSDRFSALLDRMTEGYVAVDEQWRVVEANDRAAVVLGSDRESLLGAALFEACPPLSDSDVGDRLRDAMSERSAVTFEATWPSTDASFAVRAYPSGEAGLEVYLRPTDAATDELDPVAEVTVLEALEDGLLVLDDGNRIVRVNEALTALLDVGRGTLLGTPIEQLSTATKLTDGDVQTLAAGADHVRGGETAHRIQLELPGPEGRPGLVEVRISPLPDGERVVGVIRDVTERRDREEVIRAMHEATRELFRAEDAMDACAAAVHTGADLLDLQISGIWLFDEERNRLEPVAATAGAHDTVGGLPVFGQGEGLAWQSYQHDEALCVDDVREHDNVYNEETPIRSELIVPIGRHGVLMAGDTTVGAFDEADLELAEILAANTEVALERLQREDLLEDRAEELERHDERLASLEGVLSGPIRAALAEIESTFDSGTIEEARETTDRARRLVDVAATYANRPRSSGARTGITLGEALDAAVEQADADLTTVVSRDGTLRAHERLLSELLAAIVRSADVRGAEVLRLDCVPASRSSARRISGFSVEDDGDVIPRRVRTPPFDPYAGDVAVGLELELARLLARDHGWDLSADPTQIGMRFEVADVTTLSPTQ